VNEFEVLLFLENLASIIDDDLGLELSVPTRRRIAQRVLNEADYDDPEKTAHAMMHMLLSERTLH
jgi:hypothetical protein